MDEETLKTHLNTLKEIILDEERLSTYVSVSKELCIHVNESKFLLNKAVEEIRSKHPNTVLNITYVISGLAGDNKASTYVCPESDIVEYRKRFKVIFFEHIYSVNQGKPLVDKVALMAISRFEDYPLCSGLIKSNLCIKRTSDEIGSLKSKSQASIPDQKSVKPPLKKNKEEQPNATVVTGNGESKKVPEIKIESKVKEEKISPKKELANGKKEETKNAKPPKGIAGFFSRSDSASKKSTKEIKVEKSDTNIKSKADGNNKKSEEKKMDVDDDNDDDHVVIKTEKCKMKMKADGNNKKVEEEVMEVDDDDDHVVIKTEKSKLNVRDNKITTNGDTKKKENNASSKNKSKDNNKSLTQIKKNAKVDKKRKRVLCVSDSESDEEKNDPFENDEDIHNQQIDIESEDEIPPTPAVNTIKVTSGMINPRKRRKIVTKTYTDEEGYILTRKEEVYESVSESEDIADTKENINTVPEKKSEISPKEKACVKMEVSPKNKKNGAKSTKKKISPPQKGKQSTLMSFFKKT